MTITLQALSLVEKAKLVQIRFTLHLRNQWSIWMQDGCKVYMDCYMTSDGSCLMVTWMFFQKPPFEGRSNTKPGDHGTPNAHNRWFILFYHVWGPAWIKIYRNNFWLRTQSHMTSHYTWRSVTTRHNLEVSWDGLGTHSFGLSQFHGHGSWLVSEVHYSGLNVINYHFCHKHFSPFFNRLLGIL